MPSIFSDLKEYTYDEMMLHGKTLEMTFAQDGDLAVLVGRDTKTNKVYILKEWKRPT